MSKKWENEGSLYKSTEECPSCHYKITETSGSEHKVLEGDDQFINVNITATYYERHGWDRELSPLEVHMCPKCGTLIGQL